MFPGEVEGSSGSLHTWGREWSQRPVWKACAPASWPSPVLHDLPRMGRLPARGCWHIRCPMDVVKGTEKRQVSWLSGQLLAWLPAHASWEAAGRGWPLCPTWDSQMRAAAWPGLGWCRPQGVNQQMQAHPLTLSLPFKQQVEGKQELQGPRGRGEPSERLCKRCLMLRFHSRQGSRVCGGCSASTVGTCRGWPPPLSLLGAPTDPGRPETLNAKPPPQMHPEL